MCDFISYRTAGTTAGAIKLAASNSITRDIKFTNCDFSVYRDGAVAAEVGVVIGVCPNNGFIRFRGADTSRKGYTDWKDVDSAFGARVTCSIPASSEIGGAASLCNPS